MRRLTTFLRIVFLGIPELILVCMAAMVMLSFAVLGICWGVISVGFGAGHTAFIEYADKQADKITALRKKKEELEDETNSQ